MKEIKVIRTNLLNNIWEALYKNQIVLLQAPSGFGKSEIINDLTKKYRSHFEIKPFVISCKKLGKTKSDFEKELQTCISNFKKHKDPYLVVIDDISIHEEKLVLEFLNSNPEKINLYNFFLLLSSTPTESINLANSSSITTICARDFKISREEVFQWISDFKLPSKFDTQLNALMMPALYPYFSKHNPAYELETYGLYTAAITTYLLRDLRLIQRHCDRPIFNAVIAMIVFKKGSVCDLAEIGINLTKDQLMFIKMNVPYVGLDEYSNNFETLETYPKKQDKLYSYFLKEAEDVVLDVVKYSFETGIYDSQNLSNISFLSDRQKADIFASNPEKFVLSNMNIFKKISSLGKSKDQMTKALLNLQGNSYGDYALLLAAFMNKDSRLMRLLLVSLKVSLENLNESQRSIVAGIEIFLSTINRDSDTEVLIEYVENSRHLGILSIASIATCLLTHGDDRFDEWLDKCRQSFMDSTTHDFEKAIALSMLSVSLITTGRSSQVIDLYSWVNPKLFSGSVFVKYLSEFYLSTAYILSGSQDTAHLKIILNAYSKLVEFGFQSYASVPEFILNFLLVTFDVRTTIPQEVSTLRQLAVEMKDSYAESLALTLESVQNLICRRDMVSSSSAKRALEIAQANNYPSLVVASNVAVSFSNVFLDSKDLLNTRLMQIEDSNLKRKEVGKFEILPYFEKAAILRYFEKENELEHYVKYYKDKLLSRENDFLHALLNNAYGKNILGSEIEHTFPKLPVNQIEPIDLKKHELIQNRHDPFFSVVEQPKETLYIQMLGRLQVSYHGEVASDEAWSKRKARSLLCLLAMRSGKEYPKEEILEILWPNMKSTSAFNNLHVTLSRLRKILNDIGCRDIIDASGFSIQLDPARVRCDIFEIEDCFRKISCFDKNNDQTFKPTVAAARRAVELYKGDLIYIHEDTDGLFPNRRTFIKSSYIDAMVTASTAAIKRKDDASALLFIRSAYGFAPEREDVIMAFMKVLDKTHQRTEAISLYFNYLDFLADEFGIEPTNDLRACYENLIKDEKDKDDDLE